MLDGILVGFVLVLAFLLGSFAVNNSDFWMHLAAGRLLSEGAYTLGADPFSYTTDGVTWVNHAWLFDWLLYALYGMIGGAGIAVVRGLLTVLLAGIMLRFRQPGQGRTLPAVCTALAILALSPRLTVQPMLMSFILLALTLYLLHRGVEEGATFACGLCARSFSVLWLLPPLFALWVNLDGWFILGPLSVALYWVGALAQRLTGAPAARDAGGSGASGRLGTLAVVLVVGLAACLLNPYLYRAFTLPPELAYLLADVLPEGMVSAGVSARRASAQLTQLFPDLSPLSSFYLRNTAFGRNVAGLAYFPLVALGAVSFALLLFRRPDEAAARRFPVARLVVWLAFAALSTVHIRFAAFFAVLAGPISALNLQDLLAAPQGAPAPSRRDVDWPLLGRFAGILGCLLLLLLAWPGWLHGGPNDPRRSHRVRWEVSADPSIEKVGRRLDELLATRKLQNGFNFSSEAAYYLAWFAGPQARTFFDGRFTLPPQAAEDYARARIAFRDEAAAASGRRKRERGDPGLRDVHHLFRAYRVNYVVLTGLHIDDQAREVADRLTFEPRQWVPLYADGRNAIFGWRDPRTLDNPFAGLALDYGRAAFGEVPNELRAPLKPPDPPNGPPSGWAEYAFGKPPPAPETAEADSYLKSYRVLSPRQPRWQSSFGITQQLSAYLMPPASAPTLAPAAPRAAALLLRNHPGALQGLMRAIRVNDPGPAGLPVLAVRAGRRAAAENPSDPVAYMALADAYLTLWRNQEYHWSPGIDPKGTHRDLMSRNSLRHIQYVAMLKLALRFQPNNAYLHQRLAQLFAEMNYLDVALDHAELCRQHLAETHAPGRDEKDLEREAKVIDAQIKELRKEVKRRQEEYDLQAVGQRSPLKKLEIALLNPTRPPVKFDPKRPPERGLAKLALQVLGEVDPQKLSAGEQAVVADFQIRLMLLLGMTQELSETVFDPEVRDRLRGLLRDIYDGYEALYAASLGRYAEADRFFSGWEKRIPKLGEAAKQLDKLAEQIQALEDLDVVTMLLSAPVVPTLQSKPVSYLLSCTAILRGPMFKNYVAVRNGIRQIAEFRALSGLLALEQGDTARAAKQFERSLAITSDRVDFPSRPLVVRYLARLKQYQGSH
jgi:tetratricopeptide (TPR) repeat protein